MQMRTVLIFAHECAPYNRPESTVGAQRPAQFAKYLPEFGWRAVILCCDAQRRGVARQTDADSLSEDVRRRIREAEPNASIIIPTPSLPYDGWLDRCWRALLPENEKASGLRSLVRKPLTAAKFLTGDYSQAWQPCARLAAEVVAEELSLDACIGEHGPDAGIFLARWFAGQYGLPWIADFRDPILQPLRPLARKLYAPVARRLLATAMGTVNVNRRLAQLDQDLFGLPAWSIPNGFDPEEFATPSEQVKTDRLTIAYMGNIIGLQRIEIFLEGLALVRQALSANEFGNLSFVYRGFASKQVARQATGLGVSEVVDAKPRIERDQALALLKNADMLLLLSITSLGPGDVYYSEGLYPAKVFEYFGARRPILCVPGDGALLDELIEETNTGVILRTPREIAEYLVHTLRAWEAGRAVPYQPNEPAVLQYTRRNLTGRLAAVLDEIINYKATKSAKEAEVFVHS
jgi:glycosyltransferase involved in cell wall biosynthesis